MTTHKFDVAIRALGGAVLLAAVLAGCGKSAEPEAVPAPPPAPAESIAPATVPTDSANPTETPAAPAQPTPEAPPPKEPSAVPTPTSNFEPALEGMSVAKASAKLGVPVDLRYQFDGPVLPNQPVMLHLAAVPRSAGTHLTVSIKPVTGLRMDAASLTVQKASVDGVYRQNLSITASEGGPAALRVMVSMDVADGSGFGFFTVPLRSGTSAQKQDSVKQR
jgi:hypothetical protein